MKLLSALDHSSRLRRQNPVSELDQHDLTDLAARIDELGVSAIDPTVLAGLARRARLVDIHPEVAALLTDAEAPAVVRSRAFGLVHRRLAVGTPAGTDPIRAAAA